MPKKCYLCDKIHTKPVLRQFTDEYYAEFKVIVVFRSVFKDKKNVEEAAFENLEDIMAKQRDYDVKHHSSTQNDFEEIELVKVRRTSGCE